MKNNIQHPLLSYYDGDFYDFHEKFYLIILICMILYYKYWIIGRDFLPKIIIKIIVDCIMPIPVLYYMTIYDIHPYSCSIYKGIIFCGIADIIIGFTDIKNISIDIKKLFFILSMGLFMIGHLDFIKAVTFPPFIYQDIKTKITLNDMVFFGWWIYLLGFYISYKFYKKSQKIISIIIFFYILLISTGIIISLWRTFSHPYPRESLISNIYMSIGMILFGISDFILAKSLIQTKFEKNQYLGEIAIYIYWQSLFFITKSIKKES